MFWESCPALLWFWVVKLQHATCKLVWQSMCWSNVQSRPLTHLFHFLPALSLLMKSNWASWQVGVSSDVIVHYVSCNHFRAVQMPPFYFLKSNSQHWFLVNQNAKSLSIRFLLPFSSADWTVWLFHLQRKVISRFNIDSISINHGTVSTFSSRQGYKWHIFSICGLCTCMSSKAVFIKTKTNLLPVRINVLLFKDGVLCFYVSSPHPHWGRHRRGTYWLRIYWEWQLK